MKQVLPADRSLLQASTQTHPVSFIAHPAKQRQDDLSVERLIMPQLPPPLKKHLWHKTPNFRRKMVGQAQQLLDAAKEEGPEAVQLIKASIKEGVKALNHEADLHPLEFQRSLKDLERMERALKVHSMEAMCYCSIWTLAATKRRHLSQLRAFL
ncbi:unnamed protein product [Symbiodinium natans]|uniref:Uncharacterized protein n=1 Tax=Symbiodinium natans TaxID=878477 RepID=A0A812T2J2_9DINO|nr:unnamed protein product [Symbiodinium natans]